MAQAMPSAGHGHCLVCFSLLQIFEASCPKAAALLASATIPCPLHAQPIKCLWPRLTLQQEPICAHRGCLDVTDCRHSSLSTLSVALPVPVCCNLKATGWQPSVVRQTSAPTGVSTEFLVLMMKQKGIQRGDEADQYSSPSSSPSPSALSAPTYRRKPTCFSALALIDLDILHG